MCNDSLIPLIWKQGKIITIEPVPKNIDIIKQNIQLNKLKNVFEENIAVVASEGFAKIYDISNPTIIHGKGRGLDGSLVNVMI